MLHRAVFCQSAIAAVWKLLEGMDMYIVGMEMLVGIVIVLLVIVFVAYYVNGFNSSRNSKIPLAKPHVPFLGNALAYKKHPDKFLCEQAELYGSLFRINLAGMETYILPSRSTNKQLAMAPENILSGREAISDFGFKYTLGKSNVFEGPNFHRNVIKAHFASAREVSSLSNAIVQSVEDSIRTELSMKHIAPQNTAAMNGGRLIIDDFMMFTRRVVLRAVVDVLLCRHFSAVYELQGNVDFALEFMTFQDAVEEATAAAAVLPLFVAYPVILYPCERRRILLTDKISKVVQRLWTDFDTGQFEASDEGIWLLAMRNMSSREAAEVIIGLLFAAHKNPVMWNNDSKNTSLYLSDLFAVNSAIAASQCVLFLLENRHDTKASCNLLLDQATMEARRLYCHGQHGDIALDSLDAAGVITRSVLETLRLTAHSIGAIRKVVCPVGWKVTIEVPGHIKGSSQQQDIVIPHGAYVGSSHIVPHRDAAVWGDRPESFNPNRRNLETLCADSLIMTTFSAGVHKCPGQRIATMLIRLFLVVVLGKFDLSVSSPTDIPPLSFERATLAQRDGKCRVALKEFMSTC